MNVQELVAKYKTSAPPAQKTGPMKVSDLISKYQNYQAPAAPTPAAPQSFASKMFGAAKNFTTGARDALATPVVNAVDAIDTGLNQTVGRVANAAAGKGFTPTTQTALPQAARDKLNTPAEGISGKAGEVVGTVAPYLTGAGEEEGVVAGGKVLAKTGSKVAGWLAGHLPTFAANTAIGTAQTKNIKSGAEQAVGAEVGQEALKGVGKYISGAAGRAEKALTDALTPRVVGKGYEKAATKAKPSEPSLFGKAGVDGDITKSVQNAKTAVQNVATALGKKTKDIIKSGSGQITKNFNRVTDAIGEYAQNVVKPFLQKSGVNYNFSDLRDALSLVKPSQDLKGAALKTYNEVREQMLSAVANKVSPETKGGTSLTALRKMAPGGTVPSKVTGGDPDFWDGRKIIDDIGNEATKGKMFGTEEASGAAKAWSDFRAAYKNYLSDAFRYPGQMDKVNRANEFLSTQQVKGMNKEGWDISDFEKQFGLSPSQQSAEAQQEWDSHMSNLEGLYQGRSNLSTGLNTERGKTSLQLWTKAHPTTIGIAKKTAGTAATAVGLGLGYEGAQKLLGE